MYEHTPIPEIKIKEGIIFINPGHLKQSDKKGFPPSYGFLNISKDKVSAEIINYLDGETIFKEDFEIKNILSFNNLNS